MVKIGYKMYYYKVENRVIAQEMQMDRSCNDYPELSDSERTFYLANQNATVQETTALQMNPVVVILETLKTNKLTELNNYYANIFSNGYFDSVTGWTLFCFEDNIIDYATLKNAIMDMPDNTVVKIGTTMGWQTSVKSVVYPLLTRYSLYMLPLTTGYRELKSYIEYASNETELNQITWE
jgi:hypothetical protein